MVDAGSGSQPRLRVPSVDALRGRSRACREDFTAAMLQELDQTAAELNVSRQAVIKSLVRQALDQHHVAQKARKRAGTRASKI